LHFYWVLLVANLSGHPAFGYRKQQVFYCSFSVVGLGFGMNANMLYLLGKRFLCSSFNLQYFNLGSFIGKWLKYRKKATHLISCRTATVVEARLQQLQ
jgi:hypothetical protein